jgi:hypothetical protein
MKKLVTLIVVGVMILCFNQHTFASYEFCEQLLDYGTEHLVSNEQIRFPEVNGLKYVRGGKFFGDSHWTLYNENTYKFFSGYDIIWTGEYYMERFSGYDGSFPGRAEIKPIKFYDANLNLVAEHMFDFHVCAIGYSDGAYYCEIALSSEVYKSTDRVDWVETDEIIPRQVGNNVCKLGKASKDISIAGSDFMPVIYQNQPDVTNGMQFGGWSIQWGADKLSFLLSNDNIYFVEVKLPSDLFSDRVEYHYTDTNSSIYEYGNDLVVDLQRFGYGYEGPTLTPEQSSELKEQEHKLVRLTIPKQVVYDELERQKGAPYVKLQNTILGFEQPPVIEEGRTLVPMRFLFEQMDKEVEWNQDTQTATVTGDSARIAFSIDDDTATVNNQSQTMDVPARLINGNTMIPVRFLSENLGYDVQWDADRGIISIE